MTAKIYNFGAYKAMRDMSQMIATHAELTAESDLPLVEFNDLSEEELRGLFNDLQSCWRE